MQNIFKVYAFVFIVCFCEVSGALENIDNPHDRMRMKRGLMIERRNENDNIQDNKGDSLDELLNVMQKDDEIERELDILKYWQDLSVLKTRKEETDSVEDKELGRDGLDLFKNTNKKHFRVRRKDKWWPWDWGCPPCDKTKAHDDSCGCPFF